MSQEETNSSKEQGDLFLFTRTFDFALRHDAEELRKRAKQEFEQIFKTLAHRQGTPASFLVLVFKELYSVWAKVYTVTPETMPELNKWSTILNENQKIVHIRHVTDPAGNQLDELCGLIVERVFEEVGK